MSWNSAVPAQVKSTAKPYAVEYKLEVPDKTRLVSLDFETYFDAEYTLKKLSTSEYIRDPRFKAQMVGIKIGDKPTKIYPHARILSALRAIPWQTHALLCHNTAFDGFILSHHYDIQPKKLYCTLSMARGLHSNEISARLDEVSKFYGGQGKTQDVLEQTKGVLKWSPALNKIAGEYCTNDVEEMYRIFWLMLPKLPRNEIDLIDMTIRMFTNPILKIDIPRVEAELTRELKHRDDLMMTVLDLVDKNDPSLLKGAEERALAGRERDLLMVKRAVGSNIKFAAILRSVGVTNIPQKLSPAWLKKPFALRIADEQWTYAFSKYDQDFINLPDEPDQWGTDLEAGTTYAELQMEVRSSILRALVDTRLAVKSTTNITRAERFLKAGEKGMPLPCGYSYYRAHTGRWGGSNSMNMQNLQRGGELRLSILAPKDHVLSVVDSGQIEARLNAWLWEQNDMLDAFRASDAGTGSDPYCLMASDIYKQPITKANKAERFIGKVCVLALGYGMGAPKFKLTLARGALGGEPVYFDDKQCLDIVYLYRFKNRKIYDGWNFCGNILRDMHEGHEGFHRCISWSKETILLPNGMRLKYPDLKRTFNEESETDEWTYQSGPMRKKIYGALLDENIVQALARIVVGEQMLTINRKHRIVMTTHDEAVSCVKKTIADKALDFMLNCFRTPPNWCLDLPLNAEGGHARNYSK